MPGDASPVNWISASTMEPEAVEIASDVLTDVQGPFLEISPEGGATDDLAGMTCSFYPPSKENAPLYLRAAAGKTITIKHDDGGQAAATRFHMIDDADYALGDDVIIKFVAEGANTGPYRELGRIPTHTAALHTGTPGGELGNTWASPTVDATHSGSAHHAKYTDAEAISAVEGEATLDLTGAVTVAGLLTANGGITLGGNLQAADNIILGSAVANGDLLLQATSHATRTTSQVQLFVDTNATMTLDATTQTFGADIVNVDFLTITQVDFRNVAGAISARFSDTSAFGGPAVEFATGELQVNEDIDISGHIAIGANAAVSAMQVLQLAENIASDAANDYRHFDVTGTLDSATGIALAASIRGSFWTVDTGATATSFTGSLIGLQFLTVHNPTSGVNLANMYGILGQSALGAAGAPANQNTVTNMRGAQFQVINRSANAGAVITLAEGCFAICQQVGPGTIAEMRAFRAQFSHLDGGSGAGTTTVLVGYDLGFSAFTAGTIPTAIGLRLQAWPGGPTYTDKYGISQEGVGDANWLGGYTYVGGAARPSLATANNAACTIDQDAAAGAIPVLTLDQADVSEEMMEFITTIGVGNAIEAVAAKTLTTTHFVKVTIPGGLTRYFPVGTIA